MKTSRPAGSRLAFIAAWACLLLLAPAPALALDGEGGDSDTQGDFRFLPRAKISIESVFATPNHLDTTFMLRRRTHARIFEWGNGFLDFLFMGEDIFTQRPVQINHEFDYLRLGYAASWGSVFLFWHHRCNNSIGPTPRNKLHWNDMGVGFASHTGFEEERPGNISWKISLSKMFMLSKNEYKWKGDLFFRINLGERPWAPFFSMRLDWIYDDRGIVFSPIAELGYQVFLQNGFFLSAFLRWEYLRDGATYKGRSTSFATIGIQIGREILSQDEGKEEWRQGLKVDGADLAAIRVSGGYAHVISKDYGYIGEARLELSPPLRWLGNHRVDLSLFTGITTPQNNMFPNSIKTMIRPSYCWEMGDLEMQVRYGYSRREVTGTKIEDKTTRESHEAAITLLGEVGKEGQQNAVKPPGLERRARIQGRLTFRVFFLCHNFDFWGECSSSVNIDLARLETITLYTALDLVQLFGRESPTGFAAEIGLRLGGGAGRSTLYVKFQKDIDRFWFKHTDEQYLVGLKMSF
jgi:hypothetical protein